PTPAAPPAAAPAAPKPRVAAPPDALPGTSVTDGTAMPPPPNDGLGCAPASGGDGGQGSSGDRFKGVPPITPIPPTGWFPIQPSGPGYYSVEDVLTDNYRQAPPKYPYPRISPMFFSFFDADWSYLDKPDNTEHDFFDCLKRQRFGCDNQFMNTTGGEF